MHSTRLITLFLVALAWASAALGQANGEPQKVDNIRLWHSPDNTRVVFDVSANVTYKTFALENPRRLVIDIDRASLSTNLPTLDSSNSHISAIRTGKPQQQVLRFVLELKKPLSNRSFLLSPNELYGHRLVVDLDELPNSVPAVSVPTVVAGSATKQVIDSAATPIIVAIDAGHGGEDPGAIGYRGSREKQITLAIAERLRAVIDADPRMQSFLVRRGDYYVNLHKRRLMARAAKADIFISIHADAFKKRSARGFSVFALSQRGATSAMAGALAAKENASDLIGGVSLADKDEVLAKVLVDLSMTNTISESVNLGGRVLKELSKLGKLHSKRVEQAGFAVLKSADIPSILVETGFITNPDEERKLKSRDYQQRVAEAIYTSINEYYEQTPYTNLANFSSPNLPGSNAPTQPRYHTVVRGDNLSTIAQSYGTTVAAIKSRNNLKSSVAVLGARLKLPGGGGQPAKTTGNPGQHVVRRGDSLSKISARYNVTIRALKNDNRISGNTLFIGQKIKIPGGKAVPIASPRYHKVKRGDTLSEIAERYGSSMQRIISANKLRNQTVLLGQRLRIPYD